MIKRALISVYDKKYLDKLADFLAKRGVEIVSSGGTYDFLNKIGISVKKVSDITGSAEILNGRVKTLHPAIHAGILARTDQLEQLEESGIEPFDLVVVNLYPFEQMVASNAGTDEVLENIDIGGPAMLRAAAKNYPRVTVICSPDYYDILVEQVKKNDGDTTIEFRKEMAEKVFAHTTAYDNAIASFLTERGEQFAEHLTLSFEKRKLLRYGENPHQQAALYLDPAYKLSSLARARVLSGKELSFNNLWDLEATMQMVGDFDEPFAVVVKHTNPCGAAVGRTLAEAYGKAFESDPLSAFGSIIGLNRVVDIKTAELIHKTRFVECVLAPDFSSESLELMKKKKQRRLVAVGELRRCYDLEIRAITGGALVQTRDTIELKPENLKVVSKVTPTAKQIDDLLFAFRVVKHVKSNAVIICKDGATVGIGPGQTSRVDSSIIAVRKAGDRAKGAVAASDAFFPMPDGLEVLADAGVNAVIQPGGSKGDNDVIITADRLGVAMVFTGIRHFKH